MRNNKHTVKIQFQDRKINVLTIKFEKNKQKTNSLCKCNKKNEIPEKKQMMWRTENYKTLLKEIEEDIKKR